MIGPELTLQLDNHPKHRARVIKSDRQQTEERGVLQQMVWPPQSRKNIQDFISKSILILLKLLHSTVDVQISILLRILRTSRFGDREQENYSNWAGNDS